MKRVYEVREVKLVDGRLIFGKSVDVRARVTDAAVLCFRYNQQSQGTAVRYVYQSQPV